MYVCLLLRLKAVFATMTAEPPPSSRSVLLLLLPRSLAADFCGLRCVRGEVKSVVFIMRSCLAEKHGFSVSVVQLAPWHRAKAVAVRRLSGTAGGRTMTGSMLSRGLQSSECRFDSFRGRGYR